MIQPKMLRPGDRVAIVSLSSGLGGDPLFRHRYELGKRRLETEFGLRVTPMPHALKGIDYLDKHPAARAADLMAAFANPDIRGVISMIGGDDTIRLLPHIDFAVLRENPKVFLGYSDTTVNHFMLRKAGVTSFYGPCVLAEFAENGAMHEYTKDYLHKTLFQVHPSLPILPSPVWTSEFLEWAEEKNDAIPRRMIRDDRGFVCLQGSGTATGRLLGGCLDVLPMLWGTALWPAPEEWNDTILFLETAEDCMPPGQLRILLRGLAAQGIIGRVSGILFGKPMAEKYFIEYNEILRKVVAEEAGRPELPILVNLSFGHNAPICVLPYGVRAEISCEDRAVTLLESGVTQ